MPYAIPVENERRSLWAIMEPNKPTPITPPICLADAIRPEAIPASSRDTEESIELVIEGTDIALPIPTIMRVLFRNHKELDSVNCDSKINPII